MFAYAHAVYFILFYYAHQVLAYRILKNFGVKIQIAYASVNSQFHHKLDEKSCNFSALSHQSHFIFSLLHPF